LNIGMGTIVDFLATKGYKVEKQPMAKLDSDMYTTLLKEFAVDKIIKEEAKQISIGKIRKEEPGQFPEKPVENRRSRDFENEEILIKNTGHHYTPPQPEKPKPVVAPEPEKADDRNETLPGVKVVGKIDLDNLNAKTAQVEKPVEKVEIQEVAIPEVAVAKPEPVAEVVKEVVPPAPKPEIKEEAKPAVPEVPVAEVKAEATPEVAAAPTEAVDEPQEDDVIRAKAERLTGPNVIGKIQLPVSAPKRNPVASSSNTNSAADHKRKRKRKDNQGPGNQGGGQSPAINHGQHQQNNPPGHQQAHGGNRPDFRNRSNTPGTGGNTGGGNRPDFRTRSATPNSGPKEEPSEKDIQDQIKATLARLSGAGKSGKFAQRAKFRRQKRDDVAATAEELAMEQELQSKVLRVTEFVTANELAIMMDVSVTQIISTCMSLGMFVSINQRLDAESLSIVADEFGYQIEFVKPQDEEANLDQADEPGDLVARAPIVTIMGHVDHGKTSLLDFIRKTNVIGGEAGGITQHIGAYEVSLPDDKGKITFLDTPGHEAFTAMRARGAQVTDIVIIVIAADDSVMPQTREAINHAQAAGAPIIFAFNKIDRPGANADKIREQLSAMNILVEEWGGKYQSQEISAKTGLNIDLLLEKVLLEAELLELTANPNKRAVGTVIEAALDKGRGIVTTILVQSGKLKVGDPILAGCYSGRVKALTNERGQRVEFAGPSTPVQVLGMQGAPTAGDKFNVLETEVEAREIANKRLQLQREQGLRTQKHITLDEIGRRLAVGNFKELNIIVKGDVDGSIEALSDSLLKLSTEQIQVNIISKAVGQISESDVLLASASDAIIIGFQVRPSGSARKLAEAEQIDIRLYSIIYDAINEIKAAMEGMLAPTFEEKIVANVEIRETFKISKVGTIAGCMVLDGKINRNSKIRIVREGVVIYTGELASLKRFKDDVKEVATGYECGLNIHNFNNIEVGDIVEAYENVEVKRKL